MRTFGKPGAERLCNGFCLIRIKERFGDNTRYYKMKWRTQGFLVTFMTTTVLLSAEGTSQASSEHQSQVIYGVLNASVLIPGKAGLLGRNGLIQWGYNSGRGPSLSQFLPILDYYSGTNRLVVSDSYEGRIEFNRTDGSVLLRSLWWQDQGFYALKIDLDESNTKTFHLIMNVPLSKPSISSNSSRLGSTVAMRCVAFGHVTRYVWRKDGEKIPPSYQLSDANSCLTIHNAKRLDCGEYTCTLENELASKTASYHLVIYGASTMNKASLFLAVVGIMLVLTDWPFVVWQYSAKTQRANGTHSWQTWTVKLILTDLSVATLLIGQTFYLLEDGATATVVVVIFLSALLLVLVCVTAVAVSSKQTETLRDSCLPLANGGDPVLKFVLLGTCDCFIIGAALIAVIHNNNSVCGSETLNPILIYSWLLLSCLVPASLIVIYNRYVRPRTGPTERRKPTVKCDPITKSYREEENQITYTSSNHNTMSALLGITSSDRPKIPFGN